MSLSHLIIEKGGYAVPLPLIQIEKISITKNQLNSLKNHYSCIIFISRPAATFGGFLIDKGLSEKYYAVGQSTAQLLENKGIIVSSPQNETSESLLEIIDPSKIKGQKILIVKGEKGRNYLQETLQSRGAMVDTLAVYRIKKVNYPNNRVGRIIESDKINVIIVTSGAILESLMQQVSLEQLMPVKLIVPSKRIFNLARQKGVEYVARAASANNLAMLQKLSDLKHQLYR